MPQIDMSAEAVTARLKLVSELRRLCLSLGTAKIDGQGQAQPLQLPPALTKQEDLNERHQKTEKESK